MADLDANLRERMIRVLDAFTDAPVGSIKTAAVTLLRDLRATSARPTTPLSNQERIKRLETALHLFWGRGGKYLWDCPVCGAGRNFAGKPTRCECPLGEIARDVATRYTTS